MGATAATVEATATATGLPARLKTTRVSPTVHAAKPPGSRGPSPRALLGVATRATVTARVGFAATEAAGVAAIEVRVAVIKRPAVIGITAATVTDPMVPPIVTPTAPAPAVTDKHSYAKTIAKRNIRARTPPRIIKARPQTHGITIDDSGIIGRHVDDFRICGLNHHIGVLLGDHLLLRGLQISGLLRFVTHELHRIHYRIRLIGIGIAQLGGPGKVFIQIAEHGRKLRERFYARIPVLLVHRRAEILAFEVGILLQETIRFHNLRGIRRCG